MSRAAWILPAAAAIVLGIAATRVLWLIARPLALLVLAVTLAGALAPIAARLERHMPRAIAVMVVYAGLAALAATAAWLVLPTLLREAGDLVERLPEILPRLQARAGRLLPEGPEFQEAAVTTIQQFVAPLAALPLFLLSGVFELLVLLFLSLYFLIAGPRLRGFIVSLFPARHHRRTRRLLDAIGTSMGGYMRAVAIDGAIVGTLTWVALLVVGLEYAMPLALVAALGELVPYLGPVFAALPALAIALANSPGQAATVAAVYLVLQQVESHVITPHVMHGQTDVPPALVVLALAAGFAAGGVLGALAAIPLAAAGRVLVLRVIAPAVRHTGRVSAYGRRSA